MAQLNCETEQNRNNEIKKKNTHTLKKDNKKRTVQAGVALKMLPLPISKREESAKADGAEREREKENRN